MSDDFHVILELYYDTESNPVRIINLLNNS